MNWSVTIAELEQRIARAATGDFGFALCFEVDGDILSLVETEDWSE